MLAEEVFYQTSYDGTEVAITADYPRLLPASYVSNQETFPPKELSHYASPAALSCAPKGRRSTHHIAPEASQKRAAPAPGGSSKRKANDNTTEPSSKRYGFKYALWQSHRTMTLSAVFYQEEHSPDRVRGACRSCPHQSGSRPCF